MRLLAPLYAFLGSPRLCTRCGEDRGYGRRSVAAVTVSTHEHGVEWSRVCEECGLKARRWLKGESG